MMGTGRQDKVKLFTVAKIKIKNDWCLLLIVSHNNLDSILVFCKLGIDPHCVTVRDRGAIPNSQIQMYYCREFFVGCFLSVINKP